MPLPLLPFAIPAAAAAWNGVVNAFNGVSGRTMQQNLESQRFGHQKELQEKQIAAQLQTEYMRTMSQIKLQQNNQEFQLDLQRNNQEFQAGIEYQRLAAQEKSQQNNQAFQRDLESQRFAHQKESQEKQIAAQFEIEHIRTVSQIKLQQNNQAFQLDLQQNNQGFQQQLEVARQEFQAKVVKYQCQENRKLQEFIKAVDMQMAKSNQEFQAWLSQEQKQLQIELAQYNRETQFLMAAYQREVALEMKELENWPIKNSLRQMLESHQGRNPVPIQIILAPPKIDYDRFEHLNKTSKSGFPEVEKRFSQCLRNFLEKYYPLENEQRPTKLIDRSWESSRFGGGSAVTTLFSRLKSEAIILLESEVDGDLINIRVAYWSGGQEIVPFYKTIISHLHYPKILYEFAIQRALDWETNIKQKLLAKGKTEQEIDQKFGGDNPLNLNIYRENQELAADGIEIESNYKTNSEDFSKLLALLGAYHNIIVALFTDIHYLITTNLLPNLPELLPELEKEFSVDQRLADDLFQIVVESYIGSLRAMEKDRSELIPEFAADIAFGLTGLSNSSFAKKMLDFALESWLNSRYLSVENGRKKIDVVAKNLLPLDREFVIKVNRCLDALGKEKKLSVINSCYRRAIEKFNLEKYQEAIIDFGYVIDLNPQFADAYYQRGLTYIQLTRYQEAVDDLTQIIRLDASYAPAYNYRGNAYYKLGEYQQAVDDYNRAINLGLNEAVKNRDIALGVWQEIKRQVEKKRQREERERLARETEQKRQREERERLARETEQKRQREERERLARETEQKRKQEEKERLARETEQKRKQEEKERLARETEQKRKQEEKERLARETEQKRHGESKGELFTFEVVTVNNSGKIINRTQKSARQKIEDLGNGIKLEMVYIPGGSFFMGSPENEMGRESNESPQHRVTLQPFYMSKYPITQKQYEAIMENNPSKFNFQGGSRPVEKVSWYQATKFCRKLSEKAGKIYTLPSESQWEYACRTGTTTPFYFGETITPELVNYDGKYPYGNAPKGKYHQETTNVGTFLPNAFGLYDMHGNVWEWCLDFWHYNYYGAPTDGRAWKTGGDSSQRLLRGGSWYNYSSGCRSARRNYDDVDVHSYNVGFRVVSSVSRS